MKNSKKRIFTNKNWKNLLLKDCNETQEERDTSMRNTSIEAKYIDASKTIEKAL